MSQNFKDIDLDTLRDYSQQKEQAMIGRFFKETSVPYAPFFVDLGAFDGITGSNSRFLAELGWGGIVIEPTPEAFAKLASLYETNAAVTCVHCAVSDFTADDVEMLVAGGPEGVTDDLRWHYSQVSTLNSSFAQHYIEHHGYRYRSVPVSVRPLAEILRLADCPPDLAFLCIDCEGEDLKIMQSFDFSQFRPLLLSLESEDSNRHVFGELLQARGYIEYDHTACNTLFQRVS